MSTAKSYRVRAAVVIGNRGNGPVPPWKTIGKRRKSWKIGYCILMYTVCIVSVIYIYILYIYIDRLDSIRLDWIRLMRLD